MGTKTLASAIVIINAGADEDGGTACGMKLCPFHEWAKVTNPRGPGDSVCRLPGDGGDVLFRYPGYEDERVIHINGKWVAHTRRLPKCLKIKPPSKKRKRII